LTKHFGGDQLEIMEGDIRDASRVKEAVSGIEIIFHEAAFVSVPQSMDEPQNCFDVNITGTSLIFDAARRAGVRRAVVASSAAVYGESEALPLVEETPLMPKSPYAVSKRVDEMYAEMFTNSFNFEVAALRYFNVYGPRQRPDSMYAAAVPIFARRLLDGKPITVFGDGGQTRDLINVRDMPLNIRTPPEKFSISAPASKQNYWICLMCYMRYSPMRPKRNLPRRAPVIFTARWAVRKRLWM